LSLRILISAAAAVLLAAGPAAAQGPLPPLPPIGGDPTSPGQQPQQPAAPAPGPVSKAPGSVAIGVDVAHSGFFDDSSVVPPLRRAWSVKASASQVLAADGRVYTLTPGATVARDTRSGKVVWSSSAGGYPGAYDAGTVFVTKAGTLVALRGSDGTALWSKPVSDYLQAPVASGDAVYALGDATLYAFRASDGGQLWKHPTVNGATSPALDGSRAYVVGACADALAHDRRTGNAIWEHNGYCSGGGEVTPALFADRLFSSTDEGSAQGSLEPPTFAAGDGRVLGRHQGRRPVFLDGTAVFPVDGTYQAVDVASGRQLWHRTIQKELNSSTSLPEALAIEHDVYVSKAGHLFALDGEKGTTLWSARLPGARETDYSPPLAAAPGLLLVSTPKRLIAYHSVFHPPPAGIAAGPDVSDIFAGQGISLIGVLGSALRDSRPSVRVSYAPWPKGHFKAFGKPLRPDRDGGFAFGLTIFRNLRFRVKAAGHTSHARTVYAYPRVKLGRGRLVSPNREHLRVTVRTPRTSLRGRRFVLYVDRAGSKRLGRIAAARLHGGKGRSAATLSFRPLRHVGKHDNVAFCVRGQLREALGRPSGLTRRCGARTIRKTR
jgi:outer membrane protein assembly factor BamB